MWSEFIPLYSPSLHFRHDHSLTATGRPTGKIEYLFALRTEDLKE